MILPNIRAAALAASFLTLAIVMGEFTIANLAAFHTFPIFIQYVNESQGYPGGCAHADELRHHLGGDALAARRGRAEPQPVPGRGGRQMTYLQLENLHRDFGTVKALNGINISLGEGEFLSLLGPSGCGKTTALRLVAGFDRPERRAASSSTART